MMQHQQIEVPNRAADFVAILCRAAGWNGDRAQIELATGHHGESLSIYAYADVLRSLGLSPRASRRSLRRLQPKDLPCLYRDKDGTMRLVEAIRDRKLIVRDVTLPEPVACVPPSRPVEVLTVSKPEEDKSPTKMRDLFVAQWTSTLGVLVSSAVINALGVSAPLVVLTVYDTAIPTQSVPLLWSLAELAGVLALLELILRLVRGWLIGEAGAQIERTLSQALFYKLSHLPMQRLQSHSMFQQMTRLKQFESVRDALTGSVLIPSVDLPFALLFVGVIAWFSPPIALVLMGVGVVFAGLAVMATRWQLKVGAKNSTRRSTYETLQYEIARTRDMIQVFDMAESFETRAQEALHKAERAARHQRLVQTFIQAGGQAMVALIGVGTVALATLEAMEGTLTFGGLIVIVTLVWRVLSPMQVLFSNGPRIVSLLSSLTQIDAVLAQEEEPQRIGTHARAKSLDAPLAMKNVFLRFDAVHQPALSNMTFSVNKGELVALCGPSRSGKTCLLNSFTKLMVPGTGAVTMGAIDYRQLSVEDVRHTASYCTHDTWFFKMSLRANMRMGNPCVTDERIRETLHEIGALRDLRRFRQGLDTIMTPEVLAHLSTVHLKSLSIARCLCRDSPVYLIDDAMIGLSASRADKIWAALDRLKGDHTIISVTNHINQIDAADRILCLQKGRLALDGAGPEDAKKAAAIIHGSV